MEGQIILFSNVDLPHRYVSRTDFRSFVTFAIYIT